MSSTLNFDSIIPATRMGPRRAYIELPVFSQPGVTWKGGSEIVTQYNYSATKNFVLNRRPTMPTDANFCLCIKYRVGLNVFRYKLWGDIGEIIPEVPLYTGQVIKKNFVLEVWNIETSTEVSLTTALEIVLSIRTLASSFDDVSDYSESTGAEQAFADLKIIATVPSLITDDLIAKYTTDDTNVYLVTATGLPGASITAWNDISGNANNLTPIAGAPVLAQFSFSGTKTCAEYNNVNQCLRKTGLNTVIRDFYMLLDLTAAGSGSYIFSTNGNEITITSDGVDIVFTYNLSTWTIPVPASSLFIIHFWIEETGFAPKFELLNYNGIIAQDLTEAFEVEQAITSIALGDLASANSRYMTVCDVLIYSAYHTTAQQNQIKQYLFGTYNVGAGVFLPMQITDNQAWLDNT